MNGFDNMFTYINLAIGVYLIYAAISGKGKAHDNDYPKEIKERVKKYNRIMYGIIGPVLTASSVLELLKIKFFEWFTVGFGLTAIAVYIIIFYSKFGKELKGYRGKKF